VKKAPEKYGIGDWVCIEKEGCPIGEIWMRKSAVEKGLHRNRKAKREG
jgi:hypothetical protein